jgi:molybdate transport system substrate-binding protein
MGTTPQAVPNRIARGERVDVVIVSGPSLDDLIAKGKVVATSRRELAISTIGAAVLAGAPKPDIGTVDAFKRALENAKSIAYSDSVSGVYISTVLYDKLGVSDQVKAKSTMILADPVGGVIAEGKAELGFQQISELKPVKGIDIVGPIPAEIQKVTVYVAGVATNAEQPDAAAALVSFLSSPRVADIVRDTGMTPPSGK